MLRLAYLVSHPIQYQAPLLAAVARQPEIDLKVFFCSDITARKFRDSEFGTEIQWQDGLLDGYVSEVLPTWLGRDRLGTWTPINHGLTRRLRQGAFDALWVHGFGRPFNLAAIATSRRLGLKVLIRDEATAISRPRSAIKRMAKRCFFRVLTRLVDRYLAIGSLNREYYLDQGVPAAKLGWMPYGVDNDAFARRTPSRDAARAELVARWNLDADRPVVLFVGKLISRKAPGLVLDALDRHAPDSRPNLILAGDGELAGELHARLAGAAGPPGVVTGFVPQDDLPVLYGGADLLVLPSVAESWGLVVNEAMACGLPVLASDRVGAAADLVVEGETGWTFRSGDADALAGRLYTALSDPDKLSTMRENAVRRVDRFGIDAAVNGLRDALGLSRQQA